MNLVKKLYQRLGTADRLFPYARYVPDVVLKKVAHEYAKEGQKSASSLDFPHHVVFFVTTKCNLYCSHCFYMDELNTNVKNALTLEQIDKMATSLSGKMYQLVLTGGEAFLRADLPEICSIFEKKANIKSITIMTNGLSPKKIEQKVIDILKTTAVTLNFQVSIDGPPRIHDKNRAREHSFDSAFETIRRLQNISHKGRINRIMTVTALAQYNYEAIDETIGHFDKLKNVLHGFGFVRGSANDTAGISDVALLSGFDPDSKIYLTVDQMKKAVETIDKALWSKKKRHLYYATNRRTLETLIELKENNYKTAKCFAGVADVTIYPNGDVALCEMTKSFGNIKEYDYNVLDFWAAKYSSFKKKVGPCRCAHSCNISSMLKFDEKRLYGVLKTQ
jgi:MoaA/NifB/PqqE/SkfB family radical SAM enzyme